MINGYLTIIYLGLGFSGVDVVFIVEYLFIVNYYITNPIAPPGSKLGSLLATDVVVITF